MSVTKLPSTDIEQKRQEYLQQYGDCVTTDDVPGGFGCHELLDRAHLLCGQMEDMLLTHPACFQNPAWFALAYRAFENVFRLYQEVGAAHMTADRPDTKDAAH